ncbi:pancreatic lipase-related protein 2-like isoform X2 [Apostichopus japonicus]|uniref:pancreatic lipase-related protein 2-like isoform X2 n=1 Tax=Stichopus japonicus TaxID=307972 RepID=UPI003AB459FD
MEDAKKNRFTRTIVKSAILIATITHGVNSEEICFDKFGCFSSYPRCHSAEFSFPPKSPEEIETNIYLFTNKNPEHYQDITDWRTDGVISDSFFDGSLETKVLIHGFNGKILDEINVETKDAILETERCNVIMIDWYGGAKVEFSSWNPWDIYYRVRQNTRVVAMEITLLLTELILTGDLKPSRVHLIGHSLGAHLAGYVGENLSGIRRITGLDPAGPGFDEDQLIFEAECKLDPSDADFVDVIHTDGFYGNMHPLGHTDFFPNDGFTQPGCRFTFTRNLCDHLSSLSYFLESVTTECPFIGYPCNSWEEFEDSKCQKCGTKGCPRMGYYADQSPARGTFMMGTNSKAPYCKKDAGLPRACWFFC